MGQPNPVFEKYHGFFWWMKSIRFDFMFSITSAIFKSRPDGVYGVPPYAGGQHSRRTYSLEMNPNGVLDDPLTLRDVIPHA
jgi:hypothetical protein